MDIRIGQVYRPKSGPAIDITIVDYAGPGFYVVRNAVGTGDTWSMYGQDILDRYTHQPGAQAY